MPLWLAIITACLTTLIISGFLTAYALTLTFGKYAKEEAEASVDDYKKRTGHKPVLFYSSFLSDYSLSKKS